MPAFTAKHYTAIADLIHGERLKLKAQLENARVRELCETMAQTEGAIEQTNALTLAFSKLFEKDNPKFKQFTFIEACNRDLKD
jgi:hypothetical protein